MLLAVTTPQVQLVEENGTWNLLMIMLIRESGLLLSPAAFKMRPQKIFPQVTQ
jgi:hypothetical protein